MAQVRRRSKKGVARHPSSASAPPHALTPSAPRAMAISVATGALLCQLARATGSSSSSRCRQQPAEQPTVNTVCRRSQWHSRHRSSTAPQQQLTQQWQQQLAAGTGTSSSSTGSSCRSLNSDSHSNSCSNSYTANSCSGSDSSSGDAHGKWIVLGRGRSTCTGHDAGQSQQQQHRQQLHGAEYSADSNHYSSHSRDVNLRGSGVGPSSPSTSDSTVQA